MARSPCVRDEATQDFSRLRRRVDLAGQLFSAALLARQCVMTGADVAAHVAGAEFGVELHAPGGLAPAEGVAGIVVVVGILLA
jgi:hypothetical protein